MMNNILFERTRRLSMGDQWDMYPEDIVKDLDRVVNASGKRDNPVRIDFERRKLELQQYLEEEKNKEQSRLNKQSKGLGNKKRGYEIQRRRRVKRKARISINNGVLGVLKMVKGNKSMINSSISDRRSGLHLQGLNPKQLGQLEVWEEEEEIERVKRPWSWLDSGLALTTPFRKVRAIRFGQWAIRKLRQESDKDFESLLSLRKKRVEEISERELKISEIRKELGMEHQKFKSLHNFLERPEEVLELRDQDILKERYVSEIEQKRREEAAKAERKRLEELSKKDSITRALKQMMDGTLEEKKENKLEKVLEREEWMDKPREKMTEEERNQYDEFVEKELALREEKARIRKVLLQEMKKLQNEIKSIEESFDAKMQKFFIEKLEFCLRIFEQNTLVSRLKIQLLNSSNLKDRRASLQVLKVWRENGRSVLRALRERLREKIQRKEDDLQAISTRMSRLETVAVKKELVKLKSNLAVKTDDQRLELLFERGLGLHLRELDPFSDLYKERLLEAHKDAFLLVEKEFRENIRGTFAGTEAHSKEKELVDNVAELFALREGQMRAVKKLENLRKQETEISNVIKTAEEFFKEEMDEGQRLEERMEKVSQELFLMFRFMNSNVEINLNGEVPRAEEAELLPIEKIEEENQDIRNKGDLKIKKLQDNIKIKNEVEKNLFFVKAKELDIRSKLIESQLLSRYHYKSSSDLSQYLIPSFANPRLKVTKKLQSVLDQQNWKTSESEENNLKLQIQKLGDTTNKRVKMFQKKEQTLRKEMKLLNQENELLLEQGTLLQQSVSQREEIFNMTFSKRAEELLEEERPGKGPTKKGKMDKTSYFKTVAIGQKRRLIDESKALANDISGMMEKLRNLRKKNFPQF